MLGMYTLKYRKRGGAISYNFYSEELQALVDQARRILTERKLEEGSRLRVVAPFREGDTRCLL